MFDWLIVAFSLKLIEATTEKRLDGKRREENKESEWRRKDNAEW